MCRAFNFCNPQKVEAIIEYLFDHSNQKKKEKKKALCSKIGAEAVRPKCSQSDPSNGIEHN